MVLSTSSRMLALSRRAATSQGHRIGTVTTMRDSTELAAMQGQLSSHKSVTDTLRAQTHEFANQLHTISGLTQLGEYDAVTDFVGTLTRRRAEISDAVTQRISDPAVAALLIAKTSLAAETGVSLASGPDSHLHALDPELATDVITVLGNLIDNAVDVSEGGRDARISIRITDDDGISSRSPIPAPVFPRRCGRRSSRAVSPRSRALPAAAESGSPWSVSSAPSTAAPERLGCTRTGGALFTVRRAAKQILRS